MNTTKEVIIDGVRYVPARETSMDVREAVARELAALYWGQLGEEWEAEFERYCGDLPVRLVEEQPLRHDVTASKFLDLVCARLAGVEE